MFSFIKDGYMYIARTKNVKTHNIIESPKDIDSDHTLEYDIRTDIHKDNCEGSYRDAPRLHCF